MNRMSVFAELLSLVLPAQAVAHGKSKPLIAPLVQSHLECTATNTVTSTGRPACEALPAVDETCRLGHEGTGFLEAVVRGEGIRVKAVLKGLSETCNGAVLSVAFRVRTTTHCPSEHCTLADEDLLGTSTCTVSNGSARSRTRSAPALSLATTAVFRSSPAASGTASSRRSAAACWSPDEEEGRAAAGESPAGDLSRPM